MAPQPDPGKNQERRALILDQLLSERRRLLLAQARAHSRVADDAEDALSDACVQFLRFYSGPSGEDALRWMLTVVKRCAWAIGRRRSVRENTVLIEIADTSERAVPEEAAERSEDASEVAAALAMLTRDEREALILLGLGLSYREIGDRRGWSQTKVRRSIREGRAKVRKLVEGGVNP